MDSFASNTLRTLGIVLISIVVIGASGFLLLLALCFGALGVHSPADEHALTMFVLGGGAILAGGIFAIAKLAKGIARGTPEYQYPLSIAPVAAAEAGTPTSAAVATPAVPAVAPQTPAQASTPEAATPAVSVSPYPPQPTPRSTVDIAHLRPASRIAIRNLALAISAKLAAEVLLTLSGSLWTYRLSHAPFASFRYAFLAWGIAAVAPMIVLLYALLRHPGPRAFAYSLVIPSLHIFFGLFGHTATIFVLFRATPGISPLLPLLSLLPWLLDIFILYLAWKAIRITGIQPNSTRLIVASWVIFIYTSLLPAIFVIFNNIFRLR